ncbi:hypothetical protein ICC18_11730 [Paenibacillus sp. WST5]|uniref:Uncharacterized protein n=1 Tax=Paenibacillus sedimenti TaxID=2770274 RepID=A0A926KRB4_9BACL|nr:hypothetical protein [Paenibacillus sedimenti]
MMKLTSSSYHASKDKKIGVKNTSDKKAIEVHFKIFLAYIVVDSRALTALFESGSLRIIT